MNAMNMKKTANRGFTLLELIIVLAVLAILVSWGFPSLQESIRSNRMIAQNNEVLAVLHYARSEAIRRNESVEVHFSEIDGTEWIFIDDPDNIAIVDGCLPGQLRCSGTDKVDIDPSTLDSVDPMITFNNRGYIVEGDEPWTSETIYLEHDNCSGNLRRRIDIMPTGQINACALPCGSLDSC
jgi:prepilin-type N-terminal cleavage/methylation domain-containing protein